MKVKILTEEALVTSKAEKKKLEDKFARDSRMYNQVEAYQKEIAQVSKGNFKTCQSWIEACRK